MRWMLRLVLLFVRHSKWCSQWLTRETSNQETSSPGPRDDEVLRPEPNRFSSQASMRPRITSGSNEASLTGAA